MRVANQAITRERHPLPTVDDLIHTLNGATVFSKLDLRSGYHQVPLAPESRYITTFATHQGLWRYTRLNFGTNSASEMFQKTIQDQLQGITGTLNISDDVIVFGKTQAEHDKALDAVCQKFVESNVTLNKKCEFNKSSVTFFGFTFSEKGIAPDPKKVEAIKNAPAPTTSSGVRSFLGMATYCAKFIPKFKWCISTSKRIDERKMYQVGPKQEHSFGMRSSTVGSGCRSLVMAWFALPACLRTQIRCISPFFFGMSLQVVRPKSVGNYWIHTFNDVLFLQVGQLCFYFLSDVKTRDPSWLGSWATGAISFINMQLDLYSFQACRFLGTDCTVLRRQCLQCA